MDLQGLEPFYRLGAALLIGALIGFERGWRKRGDPAGTRTAGLRTLSLVGLLGGIAGWLATTLGALVIAAGFLAVAALAVGMYVTAVRAHGRIGATTEMAALVTYALGVLAGHGEIVLAFAASVVVVFLLDAKSWLHGGMQRVRHDEFRAAIKLLLVSAVLLPILPNEGYGPGGVLNPYQLWWIVVLVSGLSLAGHFAQRFARPGTGPVLMGLIGGLVSSTALTASAARLATRSPAEAPQYAAGVAAAKAVMCVRVCVVAGVLRPALLPFLVPALAAAGAAALLTAYLLVRRSAARSGGHEPKAPADPAPAPDDLGAAIVFAAVVAAALLATHYARLWFGDLGLYATAALTGLVDVDAITVTAALSDAGASVATGAILLAAAANSLGKIGIAASLGPRTLTVRVAALVAAVIAAGAIGFAAAWI